jgi:HEPN domain-containing protein
LYERKFSNSIMFKIIEQINYWKLTAEDNLETAEILISNNKYIEGLFFCHLCIEKILKALVVKEIKDIPPKSHDLFLLIEKASIKISEDQSDFLEKLMIYQLEGRYPDFYPKVPTIEKAKDYLIKTKFLFSWFREKL